MVLLGSPVALILAWAFELTPGGFKRTEEVAPHESIRHQTGRKLIGLIAVLAVTAGRYLSFHWLKPKPAKTSESSSSVSAPISRPSAVSIPDKSIAVLPFESLSEDKSNAYFAEGIQDEILTRLSKISDLKVISRTSTMQFQGTPQNLPHIASNSASRISWKAACRKARTPCASMCNSLKLRPTRIFGPIFTIVS